MRALLVLSFCLSTVLSQMTFSDGWEKRANMPTNFLENVLAEKSRPLMCTLGLEKALLQISEIIRQSEAEYSACLQSIEIPSSNTPILPPPFGNRFPNGRLNNEHKPKTKIPQQ